MGLKWKEGKCAIERDKSRLDREQERDWETEGDESWVSSPLGMGSDSNVQESCSRNDDTVASALDSVSWLPCASVGDQVYAVVSSTVNNHWYNVETTVTEGTYRG